MRSLLLILLPLCLLSDDNSQTEQIARKLAMLESQMHHPATTLHVTYDPFHPHHTAKRTKIPHIATHKLRKHHLSAELSMIFNKKAFINGKWIKENQKIADYVVTRISEDTVFLRKGRKIIKLSLSKDDGILITKEE